MDGDMGAMIQSVLSDPEQMARITQLAQGLMGTQEEPGKAAPIQAAPPTGSTLPEGDRLLALLTKAMSGGAGKTRSTELLKAMRPYMKPEKQEKLDRAMKIARMARVAGVVMGELGGAHGL